MHPILQDFYTKWIEPTGFSGPGYNFRMEQTERLIPAWDHVVTLVSAEAAKKAKNPSDEYRLQEAQWGYAGEGPQMSLKQMATVVLSVSIPQQEKYIDLQRMRSRHIWDEVKHGQLHADCMLRGGFIKDETEMMDMHDANAQPLLSYFGLTSMFPHTHALGRAAQHYYFEGSACLMISAMLANTDDELIRHENYSQQDEERMHFLEGKYQIDAYALTPEDQQPIIDALDYMLMPGGPTIAPE